MLIYVVKPGDSVWSISNKFGVSMESITNVNKLQEIPGIVIGQALVIPTTEKTYVVKSGDNLWTISQKYGVSVDTLIDLNNLPPPYALSPDMVLRIPDKAKKYGAIEVNAYIEASTPENETRLINEVGKYLTFISPFSYMVTAEGNLTPLKDENIISEAKSNKVGALMTLTNFKGGTFDTELGHTILSNNTVQQNLINNIINILKTKGYYGLNIDFERIAPEDKDLYNNFLRKVVAALKPLNYIVGTALAPKTSEGQIGAWYGGHDYKAHGEIVDFVILMTYEWGWSGGPPMPVAPIKQVRSVINYAVSVIPKEKIMMGMPLYGYNWILPYHPKAGFAKRVSPQEAFSTALKYGAAVKYDNDAQSPFINYIDEKGVKHVIWFEDARSVQAKFNLVHEYGLRGVSYWVLGPSFPQNWYVLDDMFKIKKVIV